MWRLYGKGRTRAQLQAAHDAASKQKCGGSCGKLLPLECFGVSRGRRHRICNMCRTANAVKRNDETRPHADRIGQPWERDEDTYIKNASAKGHTDSEIAIYLARTMKAVSRRRLFVLGINKRAKVVPKPLFDKFVHIKEDMIKVITVVTDNTKLTVYTNTNARWTEIRKAFEDKGLTVDDFKAWKIRVTA